jgi:hypothetical protein
VITAGKRRNAAWTAGMTIARWRFARLRPARTARRGTMVGLADRRSMTSVVAV